MYRKFTADLIFNGKEFIGPGLTLITDENGKVLDIVPTSHSDEVFSGILMPGIINCHCHVELSHLKGKIRQKTGLVDFVQQVMQIRNQSAQEKGDAISKAIEEMYTNGIVAVGDICNSTDSAIFKKTSSIHWRNFIEISGFVDATAQQKWEDGKKVADAFEDALIVPHAPYSVSGSLFNLINENNRSLISIHNQETEAEDELFQCKQGAFLQLYEKMGIRLEHFKPSGTSSLQTWLPQFNHQQSIMLVHNTCMQESDVAFANTTDHSIFYCICIKANLYIENKIPPIEMMMKYGCKMVLGTDSLASNQQLCILEEMKMIHQHLPHLSLTTLLQWATSNGAQALQLESLGTFDKGKTPGVLLLQNVLDQKISSNTTVQRLL